MLAASFDVRVLGPVEVVKAGEPDVAVAVGKPMQRTLLGLLALRPGRVVSQTALVDALWDQCPPRSALKTLHSHVAHLRRALDAAGLGELVDTRAPGYLLAAPPESVDASRFDRLLEPRPGAQAGEVVGRLRAALALWRGDVLGGSAVGDWARAEAARLDEAKLYATEELFAAELATGQHARVATELEAFVAQHSLRERPWELLMLALYLGGRQGDALAAYRRARKVLNDELGVRPSGALRRLEASILAGEEPRPGGALSTAFGVDAVRAGAAETGTGGALRAAAAAAVPNTVPCPVTTLVGRGKDVTELIGLLSERRLVTLTGVGGCGKTRLAIAVATEYRGQVAFVDLTEVSGPDQVTAALCDAVGARGEPATEALVSRLRAVPMLLVLDNCEHLVDVCAQLVETLLRRCPGLRVLATSREALDVLGETVWPVQPLSVPTGRVGSLADLRDYDAVRLFLDRAALPAVRGLSDADAGALAAVCAGLDGLPLALELAAARTSVLTVAEIAERLRDPALLRSGSPADRPHHQALDAAVAWSYEALDQEARSRFRRLAVFAGGFTLAATAAVWQQPAGRTVDALADLVARSLVVAERRGAETRYRMLETIRHYGARRLAAEPAEHELARQLHAEHYLALAVEGDARLRGAESARWLERLAVDHENLRAALSSFGRHPGHQELRLAVALARYCRLRGRYREGRSWLTDALGRQVAPLNGVREDRAKALLSVAFLAHFEGSYASAEASAEQALAAHRELADRPGVARCLRLLGSIASERGEYDRSAAAYAEALDAYGELDGEIRDQGRADVLQMTGFVAWLAGDLDRAEPLLDRALRGYAALSDGENVSSTRVHLAAVALYRGDLARARWLAEAALSHFTELDFKEGIAWAMDITGRIALAGGQRRKALSSLLASLGVHWEVGDRWRQASVLDALAAANLADDPVRAAHLIGLATALRDELGVPVPAVERAERSRTEAALAGRLTQQQRYAAFVQASAMGVPDVLD